MLISMSISGGPKLPCKLGLISTSLTTQENDVATTEGGDDGLEFLDQPPPDLTRHDGNNYHWQSPTSIQTYFPAHCSPDFGKKVIRLRSSQRGSPQTRSPSNT